jgi:ribosome-associated toxin RatA of RatAB toxin-antitoxin module
MRTAEAEIDRDAETCYALLSDVARIPEWLLTVSEVRVLDVDARGRVTRAWFLGGSASTPHAYCLRYEHDEQARALRWRIEDATLRDLDGEAEIVPITDGRCRLRYRLHASTLELEGGQLRIHDEAPEPVVQAFRQWAEGR